MKRVVSHASRSREYSGPTELLQLTPTAHPPGTTYMSPHEATTPSEYMLSTATDRDRLYLQFDLFRDWFRGALERTITMANVFPEVPWKGLDVACGEGLYAADIESRYPHARIVGFDRDPEAIMTANTAFSESRQLSFQVGDPVGPSSATGSTSCPSFCALAHFKEGALALRRVFDGVRPGGAILLLDPTERMFDYPHPSLAPLREAVLAAWGRFGTRGAGERHAQMLAEAGFVDIRARRKTRSWADRRYAERPSSCS